MKVLLGVSGGIAAYKAAELTRALQQRGFAVQVVMTAGAERFVTPLTFAALSGHPVLTSLWQPAASELSSGESATFAMEHIQVAQECNALVIAPATANIIAKFAHGIADDLLTTIFLATKAPVLLAPAAAYRSSHRAADISRAAWSAKVVLPILQRSPTSSPQQSSSSMILQARQYS
jgi:phosphopantothenoylcysteine decarboxylase/phosphopantothenate--cysteine ligase